MRGCGAECPQGRAPEPLVFQLFNEDAFVLFATEVIVFLLDSVWDPTETAPLAGPQTCPWVSDQVSLRNSCEGWPVPETHRPRLPLRPLPTPHLPLGVYRT